MLISFVLVQLEIKNHVFFSPINWDDLYHKRITPPYNPNVVSGLLLLSGHISSIGFITQSGCS